MVMMRMRRRMVMWTMMISDSGAITGITLVHFPVRCQGGEWVRGEKAPFSYKMVNQSLS